MSSLLRSYLGCWVCVGAVLAIAHRPVWAVQTECNLACQASQQQALTSLYAATGGPTWHPTAALVRQPAGWLNTTVTTPGIPAHCGWSGEDNLCACFAGRDAERRSSFVSHCSANVSNTCVCVQACSVVFRLVYQLGFPSW